MQQRTTNWLAGKLVAANGAVSKIPTRDVIMSESSQSHGKPPEGLCCLATMEDITTEDGNYGTSSHAITMVVVLGGRKCANALESVVSSLVVPLTYCIIP